MTTIFERTPISQRVSIFDRPQEKPSGSIGKLEEYGYQLPEQEGWSLLGKKFLNVLSGTLDVLRTGEYAVGGILSGKSPITGIREKISPSEVLFQDREEERKLWSAKGLAGLAADILLDPTTYLTFGTAGVMKLSTKAGSIAVSKSGRKLMRTMIGKGASEAAARRTLSKVIQMGGEEAANKYISKSGLKFMGQVFIPEQYFGMAGKVIGKIPGTAVLGRVGNGVAKAFVPFREIDKLPVKIGGKGTYADFLYKPFERQTIDELQKGIKEIQKISSEAYKKYNKELGADLGYKVELGELTGDNFLDTIIKTYQRDRKSMLDIERGLGKKIGEIPNYLRHYLTESGRKFIDANGDPIRFFSKPLKARLAAAEARKIMKFVDSEGKSVIASAEHLGLRKLKSVEGFAEELDVAEVKTIENLQKILQDYGITLRFKPQELVRKTRLGYFDTTKKEIVIASKQPTFDEVLKIVRHEMTHGGHYHLGGMIEVLETFTAKGKFKDLKSLVENTKNIAKKEYKGILKAIPVDEKTLTSYFKTYYKKPTELLSFAAGTIQENPELAKKLFPETFKAIENLKNIPLFKNIEKTIEGGGIPISKAYVTKEGEILESTQAAIKEINEHMKSKYGVDKFFEEDFFKAWAIRKSEHIRFVNTHKFLEKTKARFGVRLDRAKTRFTEEGIELVESTNPQMKGWLLPKPIVNHLDDTMKFLTNEETMKGLIGVYDKLLSFWKVNVTGMFPAFHTRNFIGGTFNNWLAFGGRVDEMLRDSLETERILRGSDHIIKTDIGTEYTGKQILELAERFGSRGQPGQMDVYREVDKMIEEITSNDLKKIKIKASNAPRWAMEQVEDRLRIPLFLNRIKKGYSPSEAAKDVFKYHFDYLPQTGLTPFERTFLRRIIPFYTWTRGNIPLQLEMMIRQPGKYANLEKIRESLFTEKEKAEFKYLPEWMKEMFLVPLPFKDDLGKSLWAQLDLPLEDIEKLPISTSGIREIAAMLTPFLKYPIELYMNRNFYFGGDIYNPELPKEMQTRKTTEALKLLPSPIKKFLNYREVKYRDWRFPDEKRFLKRYEMDARKLHFLQSFVGRYFSTLQGLADEEIPSLWKASRYVGGVPIRSFDTEEERTRKEYEQENQSRAMIQYLQQHNLIPYKGEKIRRGVFSQ